MQFDWGHLGLSGLELIILFFIALTVIRIMGNRTVGQLSPFDFILLVGIGDILITAAFDPDRLFLHGVLALILLLVLQQTLGYLSLKSTTMRKWFEGVPVPIIQDGKILKKNLQTTEFNYDDLRQELHKQGMDMTNIQDIKLARLESCGNFSIIKNPDMQPITKRDLDNYFKSLTNNPLSLEGRELASFNQFMDDVHYLVEYLKNTVPDDSYSEKFPNLNEKMH